MTADPSTLLAELATVAPDLPAARCAGRWELYDRTDQAADSTPAAADALADARAEALWLCLGCPELTPCRDWYESLPPQHRPRGVVAGIVNTRTTKKETTE